MKTMKESINNLTEGQASMAKAGLAIGSAGTAELLGALGIHAWSDVSAIAATIVSILFIAEWVWKRFFKKPQPGKESE